MHGTSEAEQTIAELIAPCSPPASAVGSGSSVAGSSESAGVANECESDDYLHEHCVNDKGHNYDFEFIAGSHWFDNFGDHTDDSVFSVNEHPHEKLNHIVYLGRDKSLNSKDEIQSHYETTTLGGLRRTAKSVQKMPLIQHTGLRLRLALLNVFQQDKSIIQRCVASVDGSSNQTTGPTDHQLQLCRAELATALKMSPTAQHSDELSTLWSDFLSAWRTASADPDDEIETWLRSGAPMGLRHHPIHKGIFPTHDHGSAIVDAETLSTADDWDEQGTP